MSDHLVLFGGDAPGAPMSWALVGGGGRVSQRGVTDGGELPKSTPARTILVLSATEARVKRLELPARSQAQARAGAEALFGVSLAGDEGIHYAVGAQQNEAGARLAAAISASRLGQWLQHCRHLGAEPQTVALDCTLWPVDEDQVVVAITPKRAIVTGGPRGGFSIEPALASSLLGPWLADAEATGASLIVQGGEAAAIRAALGRDVIAESLPDPVATLARAAVSPPAYAPNLLQGEFAPEGRETQPFRIWRFAALLLVAAVMLQVGSKLLTGWRDHQAAAQIMAAAERDFRAARPDVRRIVNLRAQVSALANAMEQSRNHPVIAVSEPMIEALGQQPLARVDEVRHEAPGRGVRMIVTAPQAAQLEAIVAAVREKGLVAEARSVQPREGRYATELTVEAP